MKPAPFRYHRPDSVDEAIGLLIGRPDARVLAGGQSLMPLLNMRLATPGHLVDITRISALAGVRDAGTEIVIGAVTRQRDAETSAVVRERVPLLCEALGHVGHRQTRNWGTVGGSLCHLDPSAEIPTVATAVDASINIRGPQGERSIRMSAFAAGAMANSLGEGELVTAIRLRVPPPGHGWAFQEIARRHGDFAIASAAVILEPGADKRIGRATIALGGVGPTPFRASAFEARLADCTADSLWFPDVDPVPEEVDVLDDPMVPAWYRRRVAGVLVRRALTTAFRRMLEATSGMGQEPPNE